VETVRDGLKAAHADAALVCDFESVREYLGPDGDGIAILVCSSEVDCARVIALVQEVRLQQWPVGFLIVELGPLAETPDLAALDPYVSGRFQWPADREALAQCVGAEMARRRSGFRALDRAALLDWIGGHLLRQTPSLRLLAEPLALAASHDVTVLLAGETGTGKTHLARLVHECSSRQAERLLVVPCGALAPSLIESELFGHAKGAFTGADRPKVGKFEAVGRGTLLLDEIDALGLEQQAKLLRVLETGEFEPVGSNETRRCEARVVAASNWNLEEAVERGKFRRDLYYRLNVLAFYLPPLRERPQDVAALARAMAARFAAKFAKPLFALSPEAVGALQAFPWPGNVRQLENVVQQAVLVSQGEELLPQHLPQLVQDYAAPAAGPVGAPPAGTLVQNRLHHERTVIQRALAEAGQSRTRAAQALGISRVTLYKKMKKLGLMDKSA
jgi:transcriptional regulator with PAS, ATPase and Fis domain